MIKNNDLIKENFLQLTVTMDDALTLAEDKPSISVAEIVGSLGGILNLYIGFNLITIADVLDFFLTLIFDRIMRRKVHTDEKRENHRRQPEITTVEPFRI